MSGTVTPEQGAWVKRVLGVSLGSPGRPAINPAVFVKARLAWVAARTKVEGDVAKLHDALAAAYQGHGAMDDLEKAFQSKVEAMLTTLDHSLAEKLDEVNKATDQEEYVKLVQEAKQIMQRYVTYVDSEPIIAKLDANPFVPIAIEKTLTATLTTLSNAVR
jgi:hypothetical protein